MDEVIEVIKGFNRFYTRYMGIFNLYRDESPYSATEAMILFEIANRKKSTAGYLSTHFFIDKGYISRILKKFEDQGLIKRVSSPEDRRIQHLELTWKGCEDLNALAGNASLQVEQMIDGITKEDMQILIQSMKTIEKIFSEKLVKGEYNG